MGKDLLSSFILQGYLSEDVLGGYDPLYEPSWWDDGSTAEYGWDRSEEIEEDSELALL